MIECSLVKTRTMRDWWKGSTTNLREPTEFNKQHISASHATLHGNQGLEFLREVDMHHLRLTYLAGKYHPGSSEEGKEHRFPQRNRLF